MSMFGFIASFFKEGGPFMFIILGVGVLATAVGFERVGFESGLGEVIFIVSDQARTSVLPATVNAIRCRAYRSGRGS